MARWQKQKSRVPPTRAQSAAAGESSPRRGQLTAQDFASWNLAGPDEQRRIAEEALSPQMRALARGLGAQDEHEIRTALEMIAAGCEAALWAVAYRPPRGRC